MLPESLARATLPLTVPVPSASGAERVWIRVERYEVVVTTDRVLSSDCVRGDPDEPLQPLQPLPLALRLPR